MFSYWVKIFLFPWITYDSQAKPEDALDLSQMLNDHITAIVRQHPTRFLGLGTVPLQVDA
jgi:aminocarboxymuconate-semialdehyde decarboxylase